MRKFPWMWTITLLGAALVPASPAAASGGGHPGTHRLPSTIDLPDGFFPEGIASGPGSTFSVGSLADGTIYRGEHRSGTGAVPTDPVDPFSTVGLDVTAGVGVGSRQHEWDGPRARRRDG